MLTTSGLTPTVWAAGPSLPSVASTYATDQVLLSGSVERSAPLATTQGREIVWHGQPFRFVGLNVYDLAELKDPAELDRTLRAIAWSGATVVRFWAFSHLSPDTIGRVFESNRRQGLGLTFIPVLGNQWDFSPEAKNKTPTWYREGYRAEYRPHVEKLVSHFAMETDILMWELMNEPLSEDGDALLRFVSDVSSLIKQKTRHLVSVGTLSIDQPGLANGGFRRVHALPTVDVVTFHDYAHDRGRTPVESDRWLKRSDRLMDEIAEVARQLNKPLFMGEIGIKVTTGYKQPAIRTPQAAMDMAQSRIEQAFQKGAIGALAWGPQPMGHGIDGHGYGFSFEPDSPAGESVRGLMRRSYGTR